MEKPKISVIIPAYNSESSIELCVSSIKSQNFSREKYEIIVVDDGSTDKTVMLAKDAGADYVIPAGHNSSGMARNIGVKHSRGKIVAFIDSDCIAKEGWLKTISKELESNDVIGGPVMNGRTDSAVAWAEYLMEFSEFHEYKKRSIVNFVPACNLVCKKKVFDLVGGFQEGRITEDVLFGHSLKKAGFKVVFVPELQIQHLCGTEFNKYLSKMKKLGRRLMVDIDEVPSRYRKLTKSRIGLPVIFGFKLVARTRRAIRAKKISKFIITLPLIILGSAAFCNGIKIDTNSELNSMELEK